MNIQIEYDRIIVFQANQFGSTGGYGYGYDGQNFCTARFDDSQPTTIWSVDEQRPIESYGGWQDTGSCSEAELPYSSWAENLIAAQAEAQAAYEAYESARQARIQEILTRLDNRPEQEPEPISQQWITIGGNSALGWQWQEGITTGEPTPEEREFISQQGWEITQDPHNPNIYFVCDPARICYE